MEVMLCELFRDDSDYEIEILVDREDYREFLHFCKSNSVLWSTGEIIHPETDRIRNSNLARISKELLLNFVNGKHSMMCVNERIRYSFSDLKRGKIIDIRMACLEEEEEEQMDLMKQEEIMKQRFEEKIKANRELSMQQLDPFVPKSYYYVQCNSYGEILKTVDFLSHRNYKNLYDIYKSDENCIIQVNTLDKQFMIATEDNVSSFKDKMYEINDFINCYLHIYEQRTA